MNAHQVAPVLKVSRPADKADVHRPNGAAPEVGTYADYSTALVLLDTAPDDLLEAGLAYARRRPDDDELVDGAARLEAILAGRRRAGRPPRGRGRPTAADQVGG